MNPAAESEVERAGAFDAVTAPWLPARTVAHADGLLAVDKPPRLAVHGGAADLADDLVGRLASWLEGAGLDPYLGVHQRLDKDASGVLLFTRSRAPNAAIAAAFAAHDLERVYVAAVTGRLPAERGELVHQLLPRRGGRTEVVARGGQRAEAHYRVLERRGERALVELRPHTGRTHQLRVQLAAVGAPIAGDRLYGGARAPRLMLHALELGIIGQRFTAALPEALPRWVEGDSSLGSAQAVARAIRDAAWLRQPLARAQDVYRLVNDEADLLPGVTVDRFGDFAVLSVATAEAQARSLELAQALMEVGARGVYLKVRVRADLRRVIHEELAPATPIAGVAAPEDLVVHEGELAFGVRLGGGLSTGLFVDQRDNRRFVRALAPARMLNLFSYTGSFSVAAARGGATTTSVDVAGAALAQARANFALNGLDPAAHRFVKDDALVWLKRAARRGERFDCIVLDPPSFGASGFSMARSYGDVAGAALALLAPGGHLLAVTNHRKTSLDRLRKLLHGAARAAGRSVAKLKDLPAGLDCPPDFDGPTPSKSVLLTVG